MYGGGDNYRDQEIYPGDAGYRGQNTGYSLYSGNTGLSVDLPSPDSGIGPDQVNILFLKLLLIEETIDFIPTIPNKIFECSYQYSDPVMGQYGPLLYKDIPDIHL